MLREGQHAPRFTLPDADKMLVSSAEFRNSKNIILFFYSLEDSLDCTIKAIEFSEMIHDFRIENTVIIGINSDCCNCHAKFRDKYGLSIMLLSDTAGKTCNAYKVWKKASGNINRKWKKCIRDSTFIIDKKGIIKHILHEPNPVGHAAHALNLIRSMREPSEAA
ncbi:MAG: peroxiredoxin [Candidatus Polarisedimenticolaceae bacterium]|nr:peroxiredoxin [Candidatus Polarisedimenticolaceae bacterium]